MDAQAAWDEMMFAWSVGDTEQAAVVANELNHWLLENGRSPHTIPELDEQDPLNTVVAKTVARVILLNDLKRDFWIGFASDL